LARAKGPPAPSPLGALRREIARLAVEKPAALPALFERYGEAVAVRFGHSLDAARAHLEAGFERAAEPLAAAGGMDGKSLQTLRTALEQDAGESGSMPQLASVYRRALLDITEAAQGSSDGRRVRSLSRAEQYMREHYAEPLSLRRVAAVAGFAPGYFSTLFHNKQRVTFERYLTKIRIERARQLLSGTVLELERVAQLTGLGNRHYFGHVFKRSTGETPMAYRRRVSKQLG
jgi:AraC-like DNA-binding protein